MQKKFSALVGTIIILAAAVILVGGVLGYQYVLKSQNPNPKPEKITNPTQVTATITSDTITSSLTPTIAGTISGTNKLGVVLSNSGGKIAGSGIITATLGQWWVIFNDTPLTAGQYIVSIYDANNNLLTSGSLTVNPLLPATIKITGNPTSVQSGVGIEVQVSNPQNTTSASFYTTCPTGITAGVGLMGTQWGVVCNQNYTSYPAGEWLIFKNSTAQPQQITITENVQTSDGKTYNPSVSLTVQVDPTIQPNYPTITMISPNGGEQWTVGQTYNITWNSTNIPATSNVVIGLVPYSQPVACGGDACSQQIAQIKNTGTYSWTIPSSIGIIPLGSGNSYKIYVDYNAYNGIEGASANTFTISSQTIKPKPTTKN